MLKKINHMLDIPINNTDILESLDKWKWFYDNRNNYDWKLWGRNKERHHFVGDSHKDTIISMGRNHDGFPERGHYYNFKPHDDNAKFIPSETLEQYNIINTEMQEKLCTKHNALCVMYPPGGYISWHNNANASAYNLVFTWSESGNGYFKYIDGETKKEVVMQDVPGWQCKASYFGAYDEPAHKLVYHTASTDCWRITVSYIFNREEMSLGLQEDVIEEIKSK
jgi:hypothetical protein